MRINEQAYLPPILNGITQESPDTGHAANPDAPRLTSYYNEARGLGAIAISGPCFIPQWKPASSHPNLLIGPNSQYLTVFHVDSPAVLSDRLLAMRDRLFLASMSQE